MSEWTEWSECNKSCGKGHTIRTRTVKMEPQFGGDPCSETIQRKKCKIRKCNRGQANSDEKKRRNEQREKRRSKQGRSEVTSQHPGWYHTIVTFNKSAGHNCLLSLSSLPLSFRVQNETMVNLDTLYQIMRRRYSREAHDNGAEISDCPAVQLQGKEGDEGL